MRSFLSSLHVRCVVFGAVATLGAAACAPAEEPSAASARGVEGEEVTSTDAEVRASCTSPRLYFAALDRACAIVPATRGRWVPEPIFADAPEDVAEGICAFRWVGLPYSRPDRDALASAVSNDVSAVTPVCGEAASPGIGEIREIPALDIYGHAGSVGCDVCGKVRRDRIRVILPPEKIGMRQFVVPLSNGKERAFEIAPTSARAVTIELPPPPPGTSYETGRVHIY
ncbi:MAG: hypothetical protein JST00_15345 [Deltaproteobacteria bacterium]|nr:hypothetical protein [Deltaproteobacteria bacterium]